MNSQTKSQFDELLSAFSLQLPLDRVRFGILAFFLLLTIFFYKEAIDYGLQAIRFPEHPPQVTAEEAVTRLDDRARSWVIITDASLDCHKTIRIEGKNSKEDYYLVKAPLRNATILEVQDYHLPCEYAKIPLAGSLHRTTRDRFYINHFNKYDFMAAADPENTWILCAACTRSNDKAAALMLFLGGSIGPSLVLASWLRHKNLRKQVASDTLKVAGEVQPDEDL